MTSDSHKNSNKGHFAFRKITIDEYSKIYSTSPRQELSPYSTKPEVYQTKFPKIHKLKTQNKNKDNLVSFNSKLSSLKSRYSNPRPNRGKLSDSLHPITSTEFKEILSTRRHYLNSA